MDLMRMDARPLDECDADAGVLQEFGVTVRFTDCQSKLCGAIPRSTSPPCWNFAKASPETELFPWSRQYMDVLVKRYAVLACGRTTLK